MGREASKASVTRLSDDERDILLRYTGFLIRFQVGEVAKPETASTARPPENKLEHFKIEMRYSRTKKTNLQRPEQ